MSSGIRQLEKRIRLGKVALIIFAVLTSIVVGALIPLIPDIRVDWEQSNFGRSGVIMVAVNFGLIICMLLMRPNKRFAIFEPLYFIAFLFFMVFVARPLQILLNYDARVYVMPQDPLLIQKALQFGALGLVSFYAGYVSRAGSRVARRLPHFGWPWQPKRVAWISIIFLVLGVAGYSVAIAQTGGVGIFLSTLQGRSLLEQSGTWFLASTLVLIHSATVILGTYLFKTGKRKLFFLASLFLSVAASLLLGGRSTVMIYLLSLVVIFYQLRYDDAKRSLPFTVMIGVFVLAAVVFVVGLGNARTNVERDSDATLLTEPGIGQISDRFTSEFNQFDWLVIIDEMVPKTIPFQKGVTFLHLFTQFIPRAIWPAKPDPIEYTITWLVYGVRSGSPFTIIGELFLNFNIPGIIIGMFIFGILSRALYNYLLRYRDDPGVVLIYGYTYASLLHFFTRSFAPMMFSYTLFIVPTLCALWFIKPRKAR